MAESEVAALPIETASCCSAWKDFRAEFGWYALANFPNYGCMPVIGNGWRVNFCPSCGQNIRETIWRFR